MAWDVPDWFHAGSYNAVTWVEVWRGDTQLSTRAAYQTGSVTDTWVTAGPRRTLSLNVQPDQDWMDWLRVGVELRPYRGVRSGDGDVVCPLGRFPVRKFTRPRSPKTVSVSAQDRWQWVKADDFGRTVVAHPGFVKNVAAYLIAEVDPYGVGPGVALSASSEATVPVGTWTKDRSETIGDLVESIGAEAFFDRLGDPVVRDRPGIGTPVVTIVSGVGGTLIESVETIDWESVANAVVVSCSATDTLLEPVTVGVDDPADPAHRSNISGGRRSGGWQTLRYSSPVFTTQAEMLAAGMSLLAKNAGPARQWSVQMPPDVSLDASDTVTLETRDGNVTAQIQSITHPLSAGDSAQLTCVWARDAS